LICKENIDLRKIKAAQKYSRASSEQILWIRLCARSLPSGKDLDFKGLNEPAQNAGSARETRLRPGSAHIVWIRMFTTAVDNS
jgi:hypothetical protein